MQPRLTADYETRSECDLRKHGAWRYSLDPTTQILCLAFHVPGWDEDRVALWYPAFPHLDLPESDDIDSLIDLVEWIESGGLVEAHNAFFERAIWTNILTPRHGFPRVRHEQWRCSAAKAAALALPRSLGDAVSALKLDVQKDADGHTLMRKISKPRKALKQETAEWANDHGTGKCTQCKGKGTYKRKPCGKCAGAGVLGDDEAPAIPTLWHETAEQLVDLWEYCKTDVRAEKGLSESIPDLNPAETELYLLDQKINERGFQLDVDAVAAALTLIAEETADLNAQLAEITGGEVTRATQRERMKKWFASKGLELADTQGTTIDAELERAEDEEIKRALTIVRELGRSSTGKYQAMQRWRCPDGRVRGGLLYHGATTGRWSGAGVQPHNFVRGTIKDQVKLWEVLKTGDRAKIRAEYGSVMLALANALRGAICAAPGKQLYVADYASIEARVLLWLAGDEKHLELFRTGADIYCDMAASIYHRPVNKKDHPDERQLGKVAILGLGYQMGWKRFVEAALLMGGITIDKDMAQQTVDAYRDKYWMVVAMWGDQERAAQDAVSTWQPQPCGPVTWSRDRRFLFCTLPSGRRLAYPYPELQSKQTSWGEWRIMLTFEGVDPYTRQWKRQSTYGGMLCLAEGTEVLTRRGWVEIQHVGDEEVWDGLAWVSHDGVSERGYKSVITCDGVRLTPDHLVLSSGGWVDASSGGEYRRTDVRLPDGYCVCGQRREKVAVACPVCVRERENVCGDGIAQGQTALLRMQDRGIDSRQSSHSRDVETSGVRGVVVDGRSLSTTNTPSMAQLWRTGYLRVRAVARGIRELLGRHGTDVSTGPDTRASEQRRQLRTGQLLLGDVDGAEPQQKELCSSGRHTRCRDRGAAGAFTVDRVLSAPTRTFDLVNCGPRHRFVVRPQGGGRHLIVHNCENLVQAIARDIMADAMLRCEEGGIYPPVLSVHDELIAEADEGVGDVKEFESLLMQVPSWAPGCPIAAEGYRTIRYRK